MYRGKNDNRATFKLPSSTHQANSHQVLLSATTHFIINYISFFLLPSSSFSWRFFSNKGLPSMVLITCIHLMWPHHTIHWLSGAIFCWWFFKRNNLIGCLLLLRMHVLCISSKLQHFYAISLPDDWAHIFHHFTIGQIIINVCPGTTEFVSVIIITGDNVHDQQYLSLSRISFVFSFFSSSVQSNYDWLGSMLLP